MSTTKPIRLCIVAAEDGGFIVLEDQPHRANQPLFAGTLERVLDYLYSRFGETPMRSSLEDRLRQFRKDPAEKPAQ